MYHPYSGHPHTHARLCTCKDPDMFMPLPSYLQSLSPWRIYLGPGLLVPYFSALTAHTPPSSPTPSTPPPAPPLRKYSSGVPRVAQEMLCTLWVSQAIFSLAPSQNWRKIGLGAASQPWLFLCLNNLQSVLLCLSVSHPSSIFPFQSSRCF